jgi:hypothetical protein
MDELGDKKSVIIKQKNSSPRKSGFDVIYLFVKGLVILT